MFKRMISRLIVGIGVCAFGAHLASAADTQGPKGEPSREETQRKLEAAQKRLDAAAHEVAQLSQSLSEDMMPGVMRLQEFPHRAMLGINLGPRESAKRDDGVEVASVSPGGPAEQAGIKAGDVLTKMNGQALSQSNGQSPKEKLLQQMRGVEPGQSVNLEYRRAGKVSTATVKAEPLHNVFFGPGFEGPMPPLPPHAPGMRFFTHRVGPFGDLELVPLTAKLGKYFGSDQGLLVVRVPPESKLQVEEGDVILDIDGRKPSSPSHAMRILSSYQGGEKIKLGILRDHKRLSVDTTAPEGGGDMEFDQAVPGPPPPPTPAFRVQPGMEGATIQFESPGPATVAFGADDIST
jgi:hypothetical protein